MWHRISRNAISSLAATAVTLAVGLFLMPFVVHHLGATTFGIWVLVNSLVGYMGLLDLGLSPTLVKKSAESLAHGDSAATAGLNQTVTTIFTAYVILGILVLCLASILWLVSPYVFNVPPAHLGTFRLVLLLVGLQAAASFPMSIWNGLLGGLQDFHVLNGLGIATALLRAALVVPLLLSGFGLVSLVVLGLILSALRWCVSWWWVKRHIPALRIRRAHFDMAHARQLSTFSGAMFIWSIAGYALHNMDRLLIGVFLAPASITLYEVGARLATYSRSVLHSWLSTIMPAASALNATQERALLQRLYLKGTKYLLGSYTLVVVPLLGFGESFIVLWMGADFAESFWILCILLIGSLYQSQNVVAHVMLPGMGRLTVFTRIMIAYPLLILLLGIPLLLHFGILGIALALCATVAILESIFLVHILRVFAVSFRIVVRECYLPTLVSCVVPIAWVFLARASLPPRSWLILSTDVGICLVLHVFAFWTLGFSADERTVLKRKAGNIFAQLASIHRPGGVLVP